MLQGKLGKLCKLKKLDTMAILKYSPQFYSQGEAKFLILSPLIFIYLFIYFASGPIYAGIDAHFLTTILHGNTPIACAQDRWLNPNLGQIGESEILFTRGLNLPEATILYGMHTVHQYLYQLKH